MMLKTERLKLRQWKLDDFELYAAMLAEPEVCRYVYGGTPLNRFQAWQQFAALVGHWQLRGFGMFAVMERATGDLVGSVGPWQPEGWLGFEIGWTLRTQYWGRGYATEAAHRCLSYAFTDLKRSRVISLVDPANVRAIRVAERAGERFEGEVPLLHIPNKTVLQYGLNVDDWQHAH